MGDGFSVTIFIFTNDCSWICMSGIGVCGFSMHIHKWSFMNVFFYLGSVVSICILTNKHLWICIFGWKVCGLRLRPTGLCVGSFVHIYKWSFVNVPVWVYGFLVWNVARSYLCNVHWCALCNYICMDTYTYMYFYMLLGFLDSFPCFLWMQC